MDDGHPLELDIPWLRSLTAAQRQVLSAYLSVDRFPSGSSIVAPAAAALFLLEGNLEQQRGAATQQLQPGASLGLESLLNGGGQYEHVQPSQLSCAGDCAIGRLTRDSLHQLCREHPEVALALLGAVLRWESVRSELLRNEMFRSAANSRESHSSRPLQKRYVTIHIGDQARTVEVGSSVGSLLPERVDGLPVVAGLVDRKATSLSTALTSSCHLQPLTPSHWEGQRIYRRSLGLLALEAARSIAPDQNSKLGPSVGFGQRILVPGLTGEQLEVFRRHLESRMHELATRGLRLTEARWTIDEARDYFSACGWDDASELLRTWRQPSVPVVSYGSVFAIDLGPLLPDTKAMDGFYTICDEDLLILVYGRRPKNPPRPTRTMPAIALSDITEGHGASGPGSSGGFLLGQARSAVGGTYDVASEEQAWLRAVGVSSVGTFNRACVEGSVPALIRVAEGFQEKRLTLIADEIYHRIGDIDIVCIAGPSSSGKTTFIRRLCVQLQVNGITPVALGLDDYYTDRDKTPRDETGDFDFEALQALQLELLHDHLGRLLAGQGVKTAHYDFKAGKSAPNGGPEIALGPKDVLLLEGIHGLNPALLGDLPASKVFRIFVCPLVQLSFDHVSRMHASDVRLVRRIVRDRHSRGHSAAATIERWPKVRSGERRHIYPHQSHADAIFDSSLIYELGVLRVYAERYLLEVPREHPAYTTAFRLMHSLDRFVSIYPEQVPANSILREFVGGSGFEY
jgi:uridine kinase